MSRLVISFFALLGVLSGTWYLLGLFVSGAKLVEDVEYEVVHSLDDRFVLVKSYSVVQGGALASNCKDSVSSDVPVEGGIGRSEFEVYSGGCDTFLDGSPSPRVRWVGARGVEIDFSINGARSVSRDVMLRGADHSGQVSVTFNIVK